MDENVYFFFYLALGAVHKPLLGGLVQKGYP